MPVWGSRGGCGTGTNSRSPNGTPEEFMTAKQAEIALLNRVQAGRMRNWNRRNGNE